MPRTPVYPTYTPPTRPTPTDAYDSYEAEKNRSQKYGIRVDNRRGFDANDLQGTNSEGQGNAAWQEVQDYGHV